MSMKKMMGFVSVVAIAAGAFACSDSTGDVTPGTDAGTDSPATQPDTGTDRDIEQPALCEPPAQVQYTYTAPAAGGGIGRNVCTPDAVNAFLQACGNDFNAAGCTTWREANAACAACVVTPNQAPTGAIIQGTDGLRQNVEGCIDAFGEGCGPRYREWVTCLVTACDEETNCEGASEDDFIACIQEAQGQGAGCAQVNQQLGQCANTGVIAAGAGSRANVCLPAQGEQQAAYLTRFLNLVCGAPQTDAGAPTDAGTDADAN